MKSFIAKYMLYIYTKYIKADFEIYKKWALPLVYVAWFYCAVYFWVLSVVLFPIFYLGMLFDEHYKEEFEKRFQEMAEYYLRY